MRHFPVAEPVLTGNEKKYVMDCLETGWISGSGNYVTAFEEHFAARTGDTIAVRFHPDAERAERQMALVQRPAAHQRRERFGGQFALDPRDLAFIIETVGTIAASGVAPTA